MIKTFLLLLWVNLPTIAGDLAVKECFINGYNEENNSQLSIEDVARHEWRQTTSLAKYYFPIFELCDGSKFIAKPCDNDCELGDFEDKPSEQEKNCLKTLNNHLAQNEYSPQEFLPRIARFVGMMVFEEKHFLLLERAEGLMLERLISDFINGSGNDDLLLEHVRIAVKAIAEFHLHFCRLKDGEFNTVCHGDLHIWNIFYHRKTKRVTFIDNSDMSKYFECKSVLNLDIAKLFHFSRKEIIVRRSKLDEPNLDRVDTVFTAMKDAYIKTFSEKGFKVVLDYDWLLSSVSAINCQAHN